MTTIPEYEIVRAERLRADFSRAILVTVAAAGILGVGGDPFGWPSGLLVWGNLLIAGVIFYLLLGSRLGADRMLLVGCVVLGRFVSGFGDGGWGFLWDLTLLLWLISNLMTWNAGSSVRYRAR